METFNEWLETLEGQLVSEQSGCDLIFLEQVWNASKVSTLNSISDMIAKGTIIVKP